MKKYNCQLCGYTHKEEYAPEICPECSGEASNFKIIENEEKAYADEHVVGIVKDINEEILESLRKNFIGECTEVGMYIAMARQADRDGFPEISQAYQRIAYEEAEHAGKFAEMIGDVLSSSTESNLRIRAAAERGACEGKKNLAKKAKEFNLDIVHNVVCEMSKDEARHGKIFEGLLNRYFND